jgi:hypothetical protein
MSLCWKETGMRKAALFLFAAGFLAAAAYADDVWKTKPYTQWEEKDLRKVLTDSPWVKVVHVNASWRGGGSETARRIPVANDPAAPGSGGGGYGMTGSGSGTTGNTGQTAQTVGQMGGGDPLEANFLLRWASARTVRQAIARSQIMRNVLTPEEAEKALAEPLTEYAITIVGQDMTPFLQMDEKALAANAYLRPKKEKTKLPPGRVLIQRRQGADEKSLDPQSITAIVFYFERKTPSGEEAIPAQEKSAEFACETPKATIRASFDLQKMAGPQGPDW